MEKLKATEEFITKNKLKLKTQQEISDRFKKIQDEPSFLDFSSEVLMSYLTFENIKDLLKDEFVKEVEAGTKQWEQITTIQKCVEDFLDYMEFAWGKAEDQRGLSAGRSIQKLGEWLWLMDREDLFTVINDDDLYNPYGAPALIEVCNQLGIVVPDSLIEFSKEKC